MDARERMEVALRSYEEPKITEKVVCPRCGFEFSKLYARAIACQGCPEAARNCPSIRCPKCDHEFPISGMRSFSKVYRDYYKGMGWSIRK